MTDDTLIMQMDIDELKEENDTFKQATKRLQEENEELKKDIEEKELIKIEIIQRKFIEVKKYQKVKQVDFSCPTCETQILIKLKEGWPSLKDVKLLCPFCNHMWEIRQESIEALKNSNKSDMEDEILNILYKLLPAQFNEVLFYSDISECDLPKYAAQRQQAVMLVGFYKQNSNLSELYKILEKVTPYLLRKD